MEVHMARRPIAITFELTKTGKEIEISSAKYLWLPFTEGPYPSDDLDRHEIAHQIEYHEKVEALADGSYDCILAGTYTWLMSYDSEGNKDAEPEMEISMLEIQEQVAVSEEDVSNKHIENCDVCNCPIPIGMGWMTPCDKWTHQVLCYDTHRNFCAECNKE
jgi:hypothetical protein